MQRMDTSVISPYVGSLYPQNLIKQVAASLSIQGHISLQVGTCPTVSRLKTHFNFPLYPNLQGLLTVLTVFQFRPRFPPSESPQSRQVAPPWNIGFWFKCLQFASATRGRSSSRIPRGFEGKLLRSRTPCRVTLLFLLIIFSIQPSGF
jgi:hypothetical protein